MVNNTIELLEKNYDELKGAEGLFVSSSFTKCSALTLALKGKKADFKRIKEAIEVIKKNTIVFSNFRGNNLMAVAVAISLEENMETSFKEINAVYEKLKTEFFANEYLVLAAIIIYNSRYSIDIYDAIKSTRYIYDKMSQNHWFLTGHEDISSAAMIAVTSKDIDGTLNEIEEIYNELKKHHLFGSNKLQGLSHIISLFNGSAYEKTKKVEEFIKELEGEGISLNSYVYPLIGVSAFITKNPKEFARDVKAIDSEIKAKPGFGFFSLSGSIRKMFSIAITVEEYSKMENSDELNKLINTANNITLNIVLVIQIAAASSAAAASAAAASSN